MQTAASTATNAKHDVLMKRSLQRLQAGTFDEADVRSLLLGIREKLMAEAKRSPLHRDPAEREIANGVLHLLDIAHSIAHPEMKTQGPIRAYVRSADTQYALALGRMPRQKVLLVDPVTKTINLQLPAAIKTLSARALVFAFTRNLPSPSNEPDPWQLAEHGSDIELCILSLLHCMQLPALDEVDKPKPGIRRRGYLAFHTWQGFHNLYAGLSHSRTEGFLSQGTFSRVETSDRVTQYVQMTSAPGVVIHKAQRWL